MNWISIEDELPYTNDEYLVYLANGHCGIGYWMSGEFWSTGYYSNRLEVTHWTYLEAP